MKKPYKILHTWMMIMFILAASVGILAGRAYDDCPWIGVVGLLVNCIAYFIILGCWINNMVEKDRINKALTKSENENKEMYYYITRIANSRNHSVSANKLLQRLEGR